MWSVIPVLRSAGSWWESVGVARASHNDRPCKPTFAKSHNFFFQRYHHHQDHQDQPMVWLWRWQLKHSEISCATSCICQFKYLTSKARPCQCRNNPGFYLNSDFISGTLRSWGHLSFLYYMVKTDHILHIIWLKNIFPDLSKCIWCKSKWNWNTNTTFVIRFVNFL